MQEEIRDLLVLDVAAQPVITIKDAPNGGVSLAGATERVVNSLEGMVAALQQGTEMRATAETLMNECSSRSHAIFTIMLEQRRQVCPGVCVCGGVILIGSPISLADRLIGSPITWHHISAQGRSSLSGAQGRSSLSMQGSPGIASPLECFSCGTGAVFLEACYLSGVL